MANPLFALGVAAALFIVCAILFSPRRGLFWQWRQLYKATDRVKIEDALKHFYDLEYRQRPASVESLAGALGISTNQAAELIARIEERGLVEHQGSDIRLASGGRAYALRIIRVHRLWERYLAEETGIKEADWHGHAEEREHALTTGEANSLAAEMGYPLFDPHGDPIPTSKGDLPPRQGQTLVSLPVAVPAQIVHIEDEPEAVFAQLVAEGLHTGMQVQVTEASKQRIRFWGDGEEHVLAPVLAANVSVVAIPRELEMQGPFESLASLEPGQRGRVLQLSKACRGLERRRLMDLGILPGTDVEVEMRSASGDPTAYRVRGSLVALRKEQASMIQITHDTEAA